MSGSEKNRVNRNTDNSSINRVTRELKEISRFSRAKQRQRNVQKSALHVQSCFFANQKKSVLHVQSFANQMYCCCVLVVFTLSAYHLYGKPGNFFFFCSKEFCQIIFSVSLQLPIINLQSKRIKTEMLFKLSNLNSNLALTLGYLNQL